MEDHRYAVLKNDIHTWNRKNHVWDTIPKGTGGRIIDQMLVPLSITYKIIFYEGLENSAMEYVNIKDLELIDQ